jgi:hypothetical protein
MPLNGWIARGHAVGRARLRRVTAFSARATRTARVTSGLFGLVLSNKIIHSSHHKKMICSTYKRSCYNEREER